jgi:hypothetical protein
MRMIKVVNNQELGARIGVGQEIYRNCSFVSGFSTVTADVRVGITHITRTKRFSDSRDECDACGVMHWLLSFSSNYSGNAVTGW